MNVVNVHDFEYMSAFKGSITLDALTRLSSLELDRTHYRPKDLNKKNSVESLHIQHCKSRESPSHGVLGLSSVKDGL